MNENINIDKVTEISKTHNSNLFKNIITLFLVLILVFISYYLYTNSNKKEPLKNAFDPKQNSTQEYKERVLSEIDRQIENNDDESLKLSLTVQKSFIQIVNRSVSPDQTKSTEAMKGLNIVYDKTKYSQDYKYDKMSDYALFGFVFSFAENCFYRVATREIPADIKQKYFTHLNTDDYKIKSEKEKQMITFKSFINLIDDEQLFNVIKEDKSFNSYSALLKGVYLDSYKDILSKEEKQIMVDGIKKDQAEYVSGKYISVNTDSMRISMLSPLHFAIANYAIKQAEGSADDYSDFEKAFEEVSKVQGDNVGKALTLSWLKMYQLGAMKRANAKEVEINKVVMELKEQITNEPQITRMIKGYLDYGLTEYGDWLTIKKDLFNLAKENKDLSNLLESVGVKNY